MVGTALMGAGLNPLVLRMLVGAAGELKVVNEHCIEGS